MSTQKEIASAVTAILKKEQDRLMDQNAELEGKTQQLSKAEVDNKRVAYVKAKAPVNVYHTKLACTARVVKVQMTETTVGAAITKKLRLCVYCSKSELTKPLTTANAPNEVQEFGLSRAPVTFCTQYLKTKPPTASPFMPMIVFADTEGKSYIHEIGFVSLGDGVSINRPILVDPKWRVEERKGAVSLRDAFAELDAQTEGYDKVYVLFHNAIGHDLPLLRRELGDHKLDERYVFGDTIPLLKRMCTGVHSFAESKFYAQLVNDPKAAEDKSFHTAWFDAYRLRSIFRILLQVIFANARSDQPLPMIDAVRNASPENPLLSTHGMFLQRWCDQLETTPAVVSKSLKDKAIFQWKQLSDIQPLPTLVLLAPHKDVYTCSYQRVHQPTCYVVTKEHLKPLTKPEELEKARHLRLCQKCSYKPASSS